MILAASVSDNAPGGAILTFAFPVILFAVIAVVLYLLFSRPHRRIPSQRVVFAASASAVPGPAAGAQREQAGAEERGEAAPGGGRHAAQPGNGWPGGTGNVSGEGRGPGGTGGYEQGTHGTEGSE